ncbi:endonuclease domain-containing protein [Streptomyces chrestomyceticus]|uniref:endonuclease domain-containing protein n=1 Tax=Streptomyces chrestomyceticus TaxID=68185 RepID=UPI001F49A54D|nr:endonuclease domain-containing protein [Streptomyces chrestomyceticus]
MSGRGGPRPAHTARAVRTHRHDGPRHRLRGAWPRRLPRAPGFAGTSAYGFAGTSAYAPAVPASAHGRGGRNAKGRRCRRPVRSRVHVDHDRRTGKVRDVLCFSCNAALGQFKDRPDVLGRRPNIRKETCGSQHS